MLSPVSLERKFIISVPFLLRGGNDGKRSRLKMRACSVFPLSLTQGWDHVQLTLEATYLIVYPPAESGNIKGTRCLTWRENVPDMNRLNFHRTLS